MIRNKIEAIKKLLEMTPAYMPALLPNEHGSYVVTTIPDPNRGSTLNLREAKDFIEAVMALGVAEAGRDA